MQKVLQYGIPVVITIAILAVIARTPRVKVQLFPTGL